MLINGEPAPYCVLNWPTEPTVYVILATPPALLLIPVLVLENKIPVTGSRPEVFITVCSITPEAFCWGSPWINGLIDNLIRASSETAEPTLVIVLCATPFGSVKSESNTNPLCTDFGSV